MHTLCVLLVKPNVLRAWAMFMWLFHMVVVCVVLVWKHVEHGNCMHHDYLRMRKE